MKLTKEDISLIEKHLNTFKTIANNRSISGLSFEFKTDLKTIAKNNNIVICFSCNRSLIDNIVRIYNNYNKIKLSKNGRKERNIGSKTSLDS